MGSDGKQKRKRKSDQWAEPAEYWADLLGRGRTNTLIAQVVSIIVGIIVVFSCLPIVIMGRSRGVGVCGVFSLFSVCVPLMLLCGLAYWWWSGRRYFSRAEFELSADEVRRGDVLGVRYRQVVRSSVTIPGYSLRLVLRETVRYTQGTDTVTEHYDHVVGQIDAPERTLSAGDVLEEDVEFDIPAQAMHSFDEPNNKLRWFVVAEVQLTRWPNKVKDEIEFTVRAEGRQV